MKNKIPLPTQRYRCIKKLYPTQTIDKIYTVVHVGQHWEDKPSENYIFMNSDEYNGNDIDLCDSFHIKYFYKYFMEA